MVSSMGEMFQAQQRQHQSTSIPIAQAGRREFYSDWSLAALRGYAQIYTEAGIPKIWENFQISKECADKRQEFLSGVMYWTKTNGIEIDTAVLFVKLEIEEMV